MTPPEVAPPPERKTFRWTASGFIPGNNKPDAALQARKGIEKGLKPLGGMGGGK